MSSRATAAAFSLSVTIVLVAIGVGGCGDDEETESAGLPIEAVAPTEPADPDATREPQNLSELAEFPVLARGDVDQAVPAIRGSGTQTISQWLDTLVNDVANFWQQEFNLAGYEFKTVNYVVYSQPVTGCGGDLGSLGKGPAYCWGEYKMYLSVPYFQNFYGKIGDAAMAIPVAHEMGHHIQNLYKLIDDKKYRSIEIELGADCLAGIWAHSVYRRNLLEPGDLEEALASRVAVADPEGLPPDTPDAHGTRDQRVNSFLAGFNKPHVTTCILAPGQTPA